MPLSSSGTAFPPFPRSLPLILGPALAGLLIAASLFRPLLGSKPIVKRNAKGPQRRRDQHADGDRDDVAGEDLTSSAPSARGLRNLGNTCFLNSVLQVERAVESPELHPKAHTPNGPSEESPNHIFQSREAAIVARAHTLGTVHAERNLVRHPRSLALVRL